MQRQGEFLHTEDKHGYRYFAPTPLPPHPAIDSRVIEDALLKASNSLAVLDAVSQRVPDMDLFVSMYVRKEAVLSSQIEGTQATLEDILDPELDDNLTRDLEEVVRYIATVNYGLKRMTALPLSQRLFRELHEKLMSGVRGEEKNPGEFRRSQNWIGPQGCNLHNARYVPPSVPVMHQALSDLEKFIHYDKTLHPLVQCALIHYQFETIHPFLDGNGRIGRLLIILFLIEKKMLQRPVLYISYELKRRQVEYYDRMMALREYGHYEQWVLFFLDAVRETAESATKKIDLLEAMTARDREKVVFSEKLKSAYEYLLKRPLINIRSVETQLNVSYVTANKLVGQLVSLGILLQENGKSKRNRVFIYTEYMEILENQ